jgi:hypothetical protein
VWLEEAGWALLQQRPKAVPGCVSISLSAGRPDKRRRDLDNIARKAVLDLLTKHGVIEDDSKVLELSGKRDDTVAPGRLQVEITPAAVQTTQTAEHESNGRATMKPTKRAKPKAKAKGSRKRKPRTQYTDELADRICEKLAQGKTLRAICREAGMPAEATVRSWALDLDNHASFAAKFARAREIGYHTMADEILDIADHPDERTVNRDRLRIDTRKWLLSKALPKIYGDKRVVDVEVNGNIRYMNDDELRRIAAGDITDITAESCLRIAAPPNGSVQPN